MLGFTEEVQIDDDYIMPSFYCEKYPRSPFNQFMKVSAFTPDSNLTIVGNTFKVYRNAAVVERLELTSEEQTVAILRERFGITVPETYHRFLMDVGQAAD